MLMTQSTEATEWHAFCQSLESLLTNHIKTIVGAIEQSWLPLIGLLEAFDRYVGDLYREAGQPYGNNPAGLWRWWQEQLEGVRARQTQQARQEWEDSLLAHQRRLFQANRIKEGQ